MGVKKFDGDGRMSKAVVFNNTVYLRGLTHAEGDVKEQTSTILSMIEDLLNKHDSDKRHILSATIYLRDMKDFAAMNSIWDAWIEEGFEPARACVESRLSGESFLVEICIVAATK